ncbi:MAG: hypothetical protein V3V45_08615 [Candidatus Brocadiales bacterium]
MKEDTDVDIDIVREISRIEEEAERLVEGARERARALGAGLEDKLAPLRLEHKKEFEKEAQELRRRLEEELKREESRLKEAFEDEQSFVLQRERERADEVVSFLINRIREF